MSKSSTVPAPQRAAFAAATHLVIHEADRLGWTDVRHEGGAFRIYTAPLPPVGAGKLVRDAFYDAPARSVDHAGLVAELAAAGCWVKPGDARVPAGSVVRRVLGLAGTPAGPRGEAVQHDPPAGHRVFDPAGSLVYVGKLADCRALVAGGVDAAPAKVRAPRKVAAVPVEATPVAPVVELRPVGAGLPVEVVAWLDRLVYGDKRVYAEAYARAVLLGEALPVDPGTPWASKARARFDRIRVAAPARETVSA